MYKIYDSAENAFEGILFDGMTIMAEMVDLSKKHPEKVSELQEAWYNYVEENNVIMAIDN